MPQYVCIGVPYFIGDMIPARTEVAQIKASGIVAEIGAEWIDLQPDFAPDVNPVTAVNRVLAQIISAHPDHVPLVFAADCVSALGALKGLESQQPAVVWFDSHGDFNTPETSPSGFLGGMPLAMLVGRGDLSYMEGVGLVPLPEQEVILTDARDLDPAEAEALAASNLTHLPDVKQLLTAELPAKPLYIHMDTDVVDIEEMPGMSYPAPDGPSVAEVAASFRYVAQARPLAGVLFSLWNASLLPADDDRALQGTLQLVRALVP